MEAGVALDRARLQGSSRGCGPGRRLPAGRAGDPKATEEPLPELARSCRDHHVRPELSRAFPRSVICRRRRRRAGPCAQKGSRVILDAQRRLFCTIRYERTAVHREGPQKGAGSHGTALMPRTAEATVKDRKKEIAMGHRVFWYFNLTVLAAVVAAILISCEEGPGDLTCRYENDGECDVHTGICPVGTDVADCSEPPEDVDTCRYENDGECDVLTGICPVGTDVADCSEPPEDVDTCRYENDGECDVLTGICPVGTDVADCSGSDPQLLLASDGFYAGGAGILLRFFVAKSDGTVPDKLGKENVRVINDVTGADFNDSLEGGSRSDPGPPADIALATVFVLDFSDSIFGSGVQEDIRSGVNEYLNALVVPSANDSDDLRKLKQSHSIAIVTLGSTRNTRLHLPFTDNPSEVIRAVDRLIDEGALGSTNLYLGYRLGLQTALGYTGSGLMRRAVVLITDGTHQASAEEPYRTDALNEKRLIAEDVDIFAIGIEGDYNQERVSELASRVEYFFETGIGGIADEFQQIGHHVLALARSNYVVGICTPIDTGEVSLTLVVTTNEGLSASARFIYDGRYLDGDTTNCDANEVAKYQPDN